jgi:serine/threonine protein kinase
MDVFSLGQVIHILSRGELVQEGDLSEEQYLHQLEDDAEFAIDPADHHSDDIADLIRCMIQKDPRERLSSLKKLVSDHIRVNIDIPTHRLTNPCRPSAFERVGHPPVQPRTPFPST